MDYIYDDEKEVYIINLHNDGIIHQEEFDNLLKKIASYEMTDRITYYVYFNQDLTYSVVDLKKRKFTDDEIDDIVNNHKKIKGR